MEELVDKSAQTDNPEPARTLVAEEMAYTPAARAALKAAKETADAGQPEQTVAETAAHPLPSARPPQRLRTRMEVPDVPSHPAWEQPREAVAP
jgi:hypothetical protein